MLRFDVTYNTPRLFAVAQEAARLFGSEQLLPKLFKASHAEPRLFTVNYLAPRYFTMGQVGTLLSVVAVCQGADIYWAGTGVDCRVIILNTGSSGFKTIEWQLVNLADSSIISNGSQSTGVVGSFASATITLAGITSPEAPFTTARLMARIEGSSAWIESVMPVMNFIYEVPPNPTPRA